jgi:hypothetical protein
MRYDLRAELINASNSGMLLTMIGSSGFMIAGCAGCSASPFHSIQFNHIP